MSNAPIQAAIARLEKQHEEDKQGLLPSLKKVISRNIAKILIFSCPREATFGIRKTISETPKHNVSNHPVSPLFR